MEPETKRLYTLREAADFCGVSIKMLRARADRGTLTTLTKDGQRHVPHAELERAGLLPGAEVRELRAEVERLEGDLARHRQLVENTERDRQALEQARQQIELELHEQRAAATAAAARQESTAEELRALEERLVTGSWRERRQLRKELRERSSAS